MSLCKKRKESGRYGIETYEYIKNKENLEGKIDGGCEAYMKNVKTLKKTTSRTDI